MKFCWLILIFSVSFSFVAPASKKKVTLEKFTKEDLAKIEEEIFDLMFENFTDIFQDSHPSVAVPIKNVTTCIEKNGIVENLKDFALEAYRNGNSTLEVRKDICTNNTIMLVNVFGCILEAGTEENKEVVDAISRTVKLGYELFCTAEDLTKIVPNELPLQQLLTPEEYLPISQINFLMKNKIVPTEMNYCLPLRASEAIQIAIIKARKTPLEFHGRITVPMQLGFTILGKFPFKTIEECP